MEGEKGLAVLAEDVFDRIVSDGKFNRRVREMQVALLRSRSGRPAGDNQSIGSLFEPDEGDIAILTGYGCLDLYYGSGDIEKQGNQGLQIVLLNIQPDSIRDLPRLLEKREAPTYPRGIPRSSGPTSTYDPPKTSMGWKYPKRGR